MYASISSLNSTHISDCEFTHRDFTKGAIVALAVLPLSLFDPNTNTYDLSKCFYCEGRIGSGEEIEYPTENDRGALYYAGFTEEEVRDQRKPLGGELLERFLIWREQFNSVGAVFTSQNTLDITYIEAIARRYHVNLPRNFYRVDSTHTLARAALMLRNEDMPSHINPQNGSSRLGLKEIMGLAGIVDPRGDGGHNALEDSVLTAEAIARIMIGRSIFADLDLALSLAKQRVQEYRVSL